MHEAPGREALLAIALETFRAEILPGLCGDRKYLGLMIASALSIAARELEADRNGDAARTVLDAFAALYGEDNVTRAGADAQQRLDSLSRDLAREIREGVHDDAPAGSAVQLVLAAIAGEKLKLSNPKFLVEQEYSQPTPG